MEDLLDTIAEMLVENAPLEELRAACQLYRELEYQADRQKVK